MPVRSGSRTLKDALNEAMRDWVTNVDNTFYIIGTVAGPHPYPMMVRDFQAVIGREARAQMLERHGRLPDALVACVGGGSNAIGLFHPFLDDAAVALYGVEAAGDGLASGRHAAPLNAGRPGVLHGNRTYLMEDDDGQIIETHSVSAGLDYPGVGPEHAWLKDSGRATYVAVTDDEALDAFHLLTRTEGIIPPGVEPRRGVRGQARGDAAAGPGDTHQSFGAGRQGHAHRRRARRAAAVSRLEARFAALRERGRKALVPFITAGDPRPTLTVALMHSLVEGGADVIELGVPFSDPMADGPVIQRASERALVHHTSLRDVLGMVHEFRQRDAATPVVLMGYLNPIELMGYEAFATAAAAAGVDGVLTVDIPPEEGHGLLVGAACDGRRHDLSDRADVRARADREDLRRGQRVRLLCRRSRASPARRTCSSTPCRRSSRRSGSTRGCRWVSASGSGTQRPRPRWPALPTR